MAKYMETAAKANKAAQKVMELVPEAVKPNVAALLAQLVNYGFRCNPRACAGIIRQNTVKTAVRGLPVDVRFVQVPNGKGGTFTALSAQPVGGEALVEGADEDGGSEE